MTENKKTTLINRKNILVFSFSQISDAVMSTAVIRPLKDVFKGAKITYLLGPRAYGVLTGDTIIDNLIVYDKEGVHSGLSGKLRLVSELRKRNFDLVIDLRDSYWARRAKSDCWGFTRDIDKDRNLVDQYLEILQKNGIPTKKAKPTLTLSELEVNEANKFLKENNAVKYPKVAIHPGGNWAYKLWPVEKFAKTADTLSFEFNAQILIFADPIERTLQNRMRELMEHEYVLTAGVSLRIAAALLSQCDIYIGNDTGIMHIAAAMGIPVVGIFGSTDHHQRGPYGDRHIVVHSGIKLNCSPCYPGRKSGKCGKGSCEVINAIPVEQVVGVARKILKGMGYGSSSDEQKSLIDSATNVE